MKTILRRSLAAAATLVALLAAPLALATPTISITSPASGSTIASVATPAGFTITANATATAASGGVTPVIASVQFFDNGTSIGTVGGTSPFSITWIPTTAGQHTLTATVTDNSVVTTGTTPSVNTATATSIVTVSTVRTITVTSPVNNVTVAQDSSIFLRSTAVLSDSVVASVQFKVDGVNVGAAVTQAPYNTSVVLSAANGFTTGPHSLTAVATNGDGSITTTSPASAINIAAPIGAAPTVTLSTSASGGVVAVNQNVTLSASATDTDGFIPATAGGGVTFYVDGDPVVPAVAGETNPDLIAPYSVTWKPTVAKSYALQAQTIDDKNNISLSAIVNVTATAATVAPTVSLTSPTAGSTLGVGSAVSLTATATANSGATVTKVDFLAGSTVLGTSTTAPYAFTWTPTAAGAVSLTARVTDSNNAVVTSSAVSVTVITSAPTVSITAPTNGASVPLGTSATVTATAVANGGATVSRVDFLAGTTTIATALAPTAGSSYSVTWTPSASGITALTAKVTDSNGTTITSTIVNVNVTAPTVALTAPTAGSGVTLGTAVSLSAVATAASGTITKVDFFAGATLVGTVNNPVSGATSTVSWTPTATGAVSLTARVTDSNTAVVTSAAVSVTVAASVPTIALTSHTNGAAIPLGTSPTITASAVAFGGASVVRVDFLAGTTTINTVLLPSAGSTYQVTWTPTASGITALSARVTDSNGTVVTSAIVNVNVTAPSVALTAPTAASTVTLGASVSLNAVATAVGGTISKVDFLAGGIVVGTVNNPVSGATSTVTWTPTATGPVSLTARVTDSNTATVTSTAVSVTVAASALAVSITSPSSNATLTGNSTVTISATASANTPATVASVAFFVDGNQIGIDTTSPYAVTWTAAPAGLHTITAVVNDSIGSPPVTSAGINVTVGTVSLPSIFLTAPIAGSNFVVGAPVTLAATTASGSSGTVTKVEFFADSTLVGTDTTAPFSIAWTPTVAGAPNINARVTDSNGVTANAVPVPIVVNPAGTPTITLALTGGGSVIPAGSSRVLLATVADDGVVDRVEFFYDNTLIGTDRTAPYSVLFAAPAEAGAHSLTARVTDNSGNATTSAALAVEIVSVLGNPPVVGFVTPATGAFLPTGVATTLTLNASDADGTVASVQVFANGALIGNATFAGTGWSLGWTPSAVGQVSLAAIATDDKGNAIASAPFLVNVTDATSPTIVLSLSPTTAAAASTTTLPSGATRNILATVTPAPGRATTRVEFFLNGTKVAEKTIAPYSYRYKADATPGTYVLTARATDNTGLSRDVQQTFTVTSAVGSPPTVNLLAPTNGASVIPNSSTPVNLAAAALAPGGTVASVQFYANGSPVGINGGNALTAAPYVSSFNPSTTGSYILDAIATDDRGNTAVSNIVTITAAFGTPTVVVTAPNANARATPLVPITFAATATAGTGASVLLVEFLIDGQQVGTRSPAAGSNSPTFATTFQWTPTVAQLGAHQLTVRVTDTNSLSVTSSPTINVTVASIVGTPPGLQLNAPGNGAIIQSVSTVNFVATASAVAPVTISSVEFFLNDVSIGQGAPEQGTNVRRRVFDFSALDLSAIVPDGNGRYPVTLYAIARDSNNNQTISSTFTLFVAPAQSLPPAVTLSSFGIGGITAVNSVTQGNQFPLLATVGDNDGSVTTLQLFANGLLVGGSTVSNPAAQSLVFYPANTVGRFNLVAVVTDDTGNTMVSTPAVVVDVTALRAPNTALTRPADDATTTSVSAPVFLEATASSPDPTQIPQVGFFATNSNNTRVTITNNAQRVSATSNVYRFVWTPTVADTYTVSSTATVGFGAGAVSTNSTQSRRVVVNNVTGIGPTVSFSVQGATTSASTVNLIANAADPDGSIASVEFFVNRNSIGQAVRDQLASTWRLSTSLIGLPLGNTEFVALARDSSGNVAASPTSNIGITAATSLAPTISSVIASPASVAFSRQVQLTAIASDSDGTVTVQYFANGTAIGQSGNANSNYLVNWTPTSSGTFNVYAVATDNAVNGVSNTTISPIIQVTVRRNNPLQDDTAFILQSYSDIANTTPLNLVLADLADRIAAGTLTRNQVVTDLMDETGFVAPVNILAAYWVLMGQWPTPSNYTTLLNTTRNAGLTNGIGSILASPEYFLKYGVVPTVTLLNSPTSVLPADTFINNLWKAAGLGAPSSLQNLQFRSNNVASLTLGRGYGPVGLNTALAEFITNTNSTNTALFAKARAAALYYQLDRPPTPTNIPAKDITDAIAVRVDALVKLADDDARVDAALKDNLYTYRYITFLKQPQSLVVNPRSGALFTVEALGAPPIIYQWLFNGTPIANATNATLSLTNVDTSRVGTYTVVVTTTAGSATSDPATLTLSNAPTRVGNISTRGLTSGGNQVLIGGFVVAAPAGSPPNQTRQMLIRVVGPGLAGPPFNVTGALNNPALEVFSAAGALILTNDNWSAQSANAAANATAVTAIQQATARIGTFPLVPGSQDAAVLATLPVGSYTVQAVGPNANSSGVVLIEVYDATQGNVVATSPRATNVATRGDVGTGANVLIAGFVINGTTSRRILLRGVGPTLNRFGIGQNALLADPFLTLKDAAGNTLRTNDNWSTGDDAAVIAAAAVSGGAFALVNGSRDAAMIVMLPPGAYTVQLSGVNNTTGIGIVEVYDVDP